MPITLTRKAVRAWAEAKESGAIIGVAGSYTSCPIACYIHDNGGEEPSVGVHAQYSMNGVRTSRKLPPTIGKIVDAVDKTIARREGKKVLTREMFLAILKG